MTRRSIALLLASRLALGVSTLSVVLNGVVAGDDSKEPAPVAASCSARVNDFESEVWTKVGSQKCLVCHRKGGDAEQSEFVLVDPGLSEPATRTQAMRQNLSAFVRMASLREKGDSRLLLKVVGDLDHGGEAVLQKDSSGYRVLADFVRNMGVARTEETASNAVDSKPPSFFEGVTMLDDRRLLRRVTLSLAGRLPAAAEIKAIDQNGHEALQGILDEVLKEDGFYVRLREGFNDVFLTLGVDGNADQTCLSYDHFSKTRHWYQKHDLSHIEDKQERQRTEWRMAADYRQALLGEPMKLVEHIVRNDRPFTEIVTADYIMVSPYTARGYGLFDELKDQFRNTDDPFEYVPVKLKALTGRNRQQDQDSATGFYPHAGLLTTFQYLTRYPTTETNRNRLRARMYYQHFLGVDVLELAARVSDAAAVTAKYKVPTMEAAECVVCHRALDPAAGLFQDYWRFADQGVYGKRKEGWFADMFEAGFEGEDLPADDRWRALQWLGERTAKDPRFAIAMTEHVYFILTGRKVLLPPKDFDDPLYSARLRAYAEQRRITEEIASRFAATGFNLKGVFKDWIQSSFYRADGLATAISEPCRRQELDDVAIVRLLSPEQIERKVEAVFGAPWGRLNEQMAMLYGGVDSKEVTDRATDPSGAMGAIQRTLSNDVACRFVGRDFARPAAERRLFPGIEPYVQPGESAEGDRAIRQAIVHLHDRILGCNDDIASTEVDRTFQLFAGIIKDARVQKGLETKENYSCRTSRDKTDPVPDDANYTIRAWRAVVTYLLRQPEFLYE